ncbi:MAG: hypothetical protein ABIL25_04875 [candidate division WOR-3 bacterium]
MDRFQGDTEASTLDRNQKGDEPGRNADCEDNGWHNSQPDRKPGGLNRNLGINKTNYLGSTRMDADPSDQAGDQGKNEDNSRSDNYPNYV